MLTKIHCLRFAGRQAAKSWSTSIKIADKTSANLGDWIKKQCHKLGDTVVQQEILIWLPAKRQKKRAQIQSYNSLDREHLLVYEDGSEEILYLAVESYKLEGRLSLLCLIVKKKTALLIG